MLRSNWLHNVLGMTRTRKDRRSQAATQLRRVRLNLEPMEERITPSATITPASHKPDPKIAVANALAAEAATTNYILQILNNYITSVGGQTSNSTPGNGATLSGTTHDAIVDTLAALSQDLLALSKELSSLNLPPNEAALLQVLLQQQLPFPVQSQGTQQAAPASSSIPVGALTN